VKRLDVLNSIMQHIDKSIEELDNVKSLLKKHFSWIDNYDYAIRLITDLVAKLQGLKGDFLTMRKMYDKLEEEVEE